MFDPEKVDRFDLAEGFMDESPDGYYVDYSDYIQLLELYREQQALLERLDKECLIGCLSLPAVRSGVER